MSEPVNPRRYDNSRRQEAARATRLAIVDAARDLFVAAGYPSTTLGAIAKSAGVSVQTVYAQFGNKRSILHAVVDLTVAGDDDPRPLAERDAILAIIAEPDPREKIWMYTQLAAKIMQRAFAVDRMIRSAAEVDDDAAAELRKGAAQRRAGMGMMARHFFDTGHLRPDLTVDQAADRLAILIDPALYRLSVERGWPAEEYRRWLTELVTVSLLPA